MHPLRDRHLVRAGGKPGVAVELHEGERHRGNRGGGVSKLAHLPAKTVVVHAVQTHKLLRRRRVEGSTGGRNLQARLCRWCEDSDVLTHYAAVIVMMPPEAQVI